MFCCVVDKLIQIEEDMNISLACIVDETRINISCFCLCSKTKIPNLFFIPWRAMPIPFHRITPRFYPFNFNSKTGQYKYPNTAEAPICQNADRKAEMGDISFNTNINVKYTYDRSSNLLVASETIKLHVPKSTYGIKSKSTN